MADLRIDLEHSFGRVVVILDDPLITVQLHPWRLFRAHAFGLGPLAGAGGLAAAGLRTRPRWWNGGAGAKGRILVRLLGGVDLAEAGGDGLSSG